MKEKYETFRKGRPGRSLGPPGGVYAGECHGRRSPVHLSGTRGQAVRPLLAPPPPSSSYHQVPQDPPGMAYHLAHPRLCSCPGQSPAPAGAHPAPRAPGSCPALGGRADELSSANHARGGRTRPGCLLPSRGHGGGPTRGRISTF
ncbi:unnamed protein product [Boreogadus saida]